MVKAVIFDFDGVILESERLKVDSYYKIFEEVAESERVVDGVMEDFNRKPRAIIIKNILLRLQAKNLMNFEDLDKEKEKYVDIYTKSVASEILKVPFISGALESLAELKEDFDLFVMSNTPNEALQKTLEERNLKKYFKEFFGSTPDAGKMEHTENIMKTYNLNPGDVVFVGDGLSDKKCADFYKMRFIGILSDVHNLGGEDLQFKLKDLVGLPELIGSLP